MKAVKIKRRLRKKRIGRRWLKSPSSSAQSRVIHYRVCWLADHRVRGNDEISLALTERRTCTSWPKRYRRGWLSSGQGYLGRFHIPAQTAAGVQEQTANRKPFFVVHDGHSSRNCSNSQATSKCLSVLRSAFAPYRQILPRTYSLGALA